MERRVVITGLGAVTPLGNDVATTWRLLLDGRSGIGPISYFDASDLPVRIAGEVKRFDGDGLFGRREARRMDQFTQFALAAAREAVTDAGLVFDDGLKRETGALIGTAIGGMVTLLENYDALKTAGARRVSPFMVPMMMPNAPSGNVAIEYGLRGPNLAIGTACATGSHAIGESAAIIQRGDAQVMIAGGAEAIISPVAVAAFTNMGALSTRNEEPTRASRPFEADRDGFVMSEGAAVLVIESLECAQRRGARIYAELRGYGATADAFHITAPEEGGIGASLAIQAALERAGLPPTAVDYINAHGTGTPLNDRTETQAIRRVFGSHADRLAVSSTKSMLGHLLGAGGAIEALACVKSLETGWIHPTINYDRPDPECDLDFVPNVPRRAQPRIALSNSFGFGGHNGCLLFERWEADV